MDDCEDDGAGPPSFQVGVESSTERLHELQFSLSHADDPEKDRIAGEIEAITRERLLSEAESGTGGFLEDDDVMGCFLPIQRMDSREVIFDQRPKKAKILGGYVMGDKLGEGSYAKVKEAVHQETLCRRAVKIMKRKRLRKIPHGEENVEREIKLLAKLAHPNVMKLVEVFYNDEKGKIYMVIEYCCAVLKDMLDAAPMGRFPIWQSHFYFTQLIDGLDYLHAMHVVHKDIKPGNLLLDTAGVLKIADFGIAEELSLFGQDTCKTSPGTPAFQPPEVANGVEEFSGPKLDVWSSGVTLYNFVTGGYPFEGDTIFRLFENIAKCEFGFPVGSANEVEPVLESLIRGMLAKDPNDRLSVKGVIAHDWCRKKHPRTSPPVTVQPRDPDDLAICTSVIPYLCDLHFGSQCDVEEAGNGEHMPELISEHEIRLAEEARHSAEVEAKAAADTDSISAGQKTEEKAGKCIRVKKMRKNCTIT